MKRTEMPLSEPTPPLKCLACGKEHQCDVNGDWGCLVLLDQRLIPFAVWGAWCDETCFANWFSDQDTKAIFG